MRRRYLIWMLGAREVIRLVVEDHEECLVIEHKLDQGKGAIPYHSSPPDRIAMGDTHPVRSYFMARNVSHYHIEKLA